MPDASPCLAVVEHECGSVASYTCMCVCVCECVLGDLVWLSGSGAVCILYCVFSGSRVERRVLRRSVCGDVFGGLDGGDVSRELY